MRVSHVILGLALLLASGSRDAGAQCSYTALASGSSMVASASPTFTSFNQTQRYWSVVAVRSAPGDNWDLGIYQATDIAPHCVATLLGSSSATSGVDLVVGDFNAGHNPLGVHYAVPSRVLGSGPAVLEWDDGAHTLLVNAPLVEQATGPGDVVEIWDVQLTAGSTYTLQFSPSGASLKLLLFRSGAGAYWAGRGSALVETGTTVTFVPPSTGFYGLAVVNDDGAVGSYRLGVGRCDPPSNLTSGTAVTTSSAEKYYAFTQTASFWMALGARGASDWNVDVYQSPSGGAWPACFSDLRANSAAPAPAVDFVVGNFNGLFVGTYYARVHLAGGLGSGSATVEWDDGPDFVAVDAPPTAGTTGPTDVLQAWDVYLESGTTYQFSLSATGSAMKLFLFSPRLAGGWGGRAGSVLQVSGPSGSGVFAADSSDWHGLVLTNEDGGSGSFSFGVTSSLVSVDDPAGATRTAFRGVVPNPGRGALSLQYSLQEPSTVVFDVVSVAGRIVAETRAEERPAGHWTHAWDGRGRSGARLGAGVYFVRMRVGEGVIARRKVVLLD